MTLRTKTLTAIAALTISAGGFAMAQDTSPAGQEPATEAQPAEETGTAPAADTETGAGETATDAADDTAAEGADAEEPAAEEAADEAVTEDAAEEDASEEPAAEEPAAEDAAEAEEAPAEEAAEEPATEEASEAEGEAEEPAADEGTADDAAAEEAAEEAPAAAEAPAEDAGEADAAEEVAEAEGEAEAEEPATDEAAEEHAAGDSHGAGHVEDVSFSFEGPFGKYDQFQLQRGLQVYTEVCAACHGMKFVPIRTLSDDGGPGLPENQVRAYAANLNPIMDPETEEERPRLPTDHFPEVTGMGMGPDLSLMAKARAGFHGPQGTGINQLLRGIGGPEYIHAILTGYTGETVEQAGTTLYENTAFPGGWISMPPPVMDDMVSYEDGTEATADQISMDVSAFLMWTAEPKMMDRKQVGLVSVLFLIVLSALLYLTNKRLWAPIKGKHRKAD